VRTLCSQNHYRCRYELTSSLNLPATPNDVDLMFEGANPSPFGKGTETVYDGTYRLAKEYKVCLCFNRRVEHVERSISPLAA
jgi:hypothetical protein